MTDLAGGLRRYGLTTLGAIALAGVGLAAVFRGPGDAEALALSAVVVVGVQAVTFALLVTRPRQGLMAAWGVGMLLRFLTLVVYGLVVARVLVMPLAAALFSMATFFLISTLLEPLFLK